MKERALDSPGTNRATVQWITKVRGNGDWWNLKQLHRNLLERRQALAKNDSGAHADDDGGVSPNNK
jgi:hypothetical protein